MQATPIRLANAVLWPLTIWGSLSQLENHPADDYVERTTPIAATAIAFWVCLAALVAFTLLNQGTTVVADNGDIVRLIRRTDMGGVLWFFLPVIYLVGFWLFTARDERFPR